MSEALFDGFDVPADPAPKSTSGERRRQRHDALIAAGLHPLSAHATGGALRLLGGESTCGECAHRRQVNTGTARNFPKCVADGRRRVTRGEATDCRASWPACVDFEPVPSALADGGPE